MARAHSIKIVPANWIFVFIATAATLAFYLVFAVILLKNVPIVKDTWLARVLADEQHINLGSYLAFSIAMTFLVTRYFVIRLQNKWLADSALLSSEHHVVLPNDAIELRQRLREMKSKDSRAIPVQLLDAALQQSRVAWSPSAVSEAIKTRADSIHGQVDSEYGMIKYLIWAIPSIGFVGTVFGLGAAIGAMRVIPGQETSQQEQMQNAITNLFTAFDTTLIALVLSIVLMFVFHFVQSREDSFVVTSVDWCIRGFALRMHAGESA